MTKFLILIPLLLLASSAWAQVIFVEMEILSESVVNFDGSTTLSIDQNEPRRITIGRNDDRAISFSVDGENTSYTVEIGDMVFLNESDAQLMRSEIIASYYMGEPYNNLLSFNSRRAEISLPVYRTRGRQKKSDPVRFYIYGNFIFDDNVFSTIFAYSTIKLEFN